MGDYYEQESETASGAARFVDTKTLPNIEVSAASCPVCAVAVVGVQRYGRRLKHRQLVRNLKHFMLQQNAKLMEADTQFAQAVDTMERNVPNFLHTLSTLLELNPTTTVKQTTAKRGRLGCIEVEGDLLPNSDFLSLFMSYDIHPKQEKAWMELVMPAQKVMKLFDDIRENAGRSPALRLYEASVFKFRETTTTSTTTDAANVEIPGEKDTNTTKDPEATNDENNIQRLMDECARECFLSPDRQSGSSYVRAIQGRLNLLQSVLDAAFRAMDTAGAATGWYWLVDDLMKCWLMHGDMLRKATIQGGYPKMKLCIEANLAQLYSMRFTWLTYRSLSTSSSADETNADSIAGRQEVAQKHAFKSCMDFVTLVNEATFPEDQDVSINVLRHCRERVYAIKTHLEMDAKVAMGTRSTALGLPDRFNILRIHPTHMFAEDHWRRCDNGHSAARIL
ncbi:hypothetical protein BGZ73_005252 [Actinomortierella ambigua]|nr:hypothetical protein BGZ73_005252 [Actinomortierella ambigua]